MGLWDRQITDLEALGVRFSDLELRALEDPEEGMYVLHLHPLFDPSSPEGQIWHMTDENDEPVYAPEIIEITHPDSKIANHGWPGTPTLAEVMAFQHDALSEKYPSYFGRLASDDGTHWGTYVRVEDYYPYPFWTCLPIGDSMADAAAQALVSAHQKRIANSLYGAIEEICQFEESAEFCIQVDMLWEIQHNGYVTSDDEQRAIEEAFEYYNDPEMYMKGLVQAYDDLIKAKYVHSPKIPQEKRDNADLVGLRFEPMEKFIGDDWLALDMWKSIQSRMRFMRARMKSLYGDQEVHRINALEAVYG